jgi:hypothetical protein
MLQSLIADQRSAAQGLQARQRCVYQWQEAALTPQGKRAFRHNALLWGVVDHIERAHLATVRTGIRHIIQIILLATNHTL